ncbi:unnamed protein product [Soboliphyme baturini]|uniref:Fucosyltransferase n=1 Tax=Soboliphyme baturini TaxID=241478 RepID=A0A183IRA1_9BILA|nr:unnamed protein product [Soboliphyme baturini]
MANVRKKRICVVCAYVLIYLIVIVTRTDINIPLEQSKEDYRDGVEFPQQVRSSRIIWPEDSREEDRIIDQITFFPRTTEKTRTRVIYLATDLLPWLDGGDHLKGDEFRDCIARNCKLTIDHGEGASADAVIVHGRAPPFGRHHTSQIWIFYSLESPMNTPDLSALGDGINWTATYRMDSDIVAPYGKFLLYDTDAKPSVDPHHKNYAEGKTRLAAWFASNCFTSNHRLEYINELMRFMPVDTFGKCGHLRCGHYSDKCPQLLKQRYKFYLAFENSNCREYITEKLFLNAFK